MLYKTIVLELLEQRPELVEPLKRERRLLAEIERRAEELANRHAEWQRLLAESRPGSEAEQIASEALEIALEELTRRLSDGWDEAEADAFLDRALAGRRHPTPNA